MTEKTRDYSQFVFLPDNRDGVKPQQVAWLVEAISKNNLLHLNPIIVNEKMEIINGQHRTLAAKALGVDIYYNIEPGLNSKDMIGMNYSIPWTLCDYLNYYVKNCYSDYIQLADFMKKYDLSLAIAFNMLHGSSHTGYKSFKMGHFKFIQEMSHLEIEYCWQTIDFIRKRNGGASYITSSKFWNALLKLVRHPFFNHEKWMKNLQQMVEECGPKAKKEFYVKMLTDIYNFRNSRKINLHEELI